MDVNKHLESIMAALPDGIVIVDLEGKIIFANQLAEKILGIPRDRLINRSSFDSAWNFSLPDGQSPSQEDLYFDRILKNKEVIHNLERALVRPDGTKVVLSINAGPLLDESGKVSGLIASFTDITGDKNMQDSLVASEREKTIMMNSVTDHLIYYVDGMNIYWANQAAADSLNMTPEELVGKKCHELWHGRSGPCPDCPIIKARKSGEVEEKEITTPDNRVWLVRGYPVFDKVGKIIGIFEITREITDYVNAVKALEESERRLNAAIESLPFDFYILDKSGKYVLANSVVKQHWAEIRGQTPEQLGEMVGKGPAEMGVGKELLAVWEENNRRALRGELVKEETEIPFPSGKRYFLNILSPVYYGDVIWEVLGVNIDITDRKQAEVALAAEKERLTVTLRSIGDGVITTDTRGRVALINKAAEKLTGWTQKQAQGKPLEKVFQILDESTREPMGSPVDRVMKNGGVISLPIRSILISKDGAERIVTDGVSPILDAESNPVGVVVVFQDITERQKMEEELARADKLESLGILAGGIAHDFNNILTAILGNISFAKSMAADDEKVGARLTEAEKACLMAKDLTHQLLTFSKGGAPVKTTASITGLIRETAEFALGGSNVRCEFDFQEGLMPVDVDPGQISQVINNLIINADQAMPKGGTMKITAENYLVDHSPDEKLSALTPGKYVKITITDRGIGIPEDILPKVFDPFFTTKQKGSGLGLAIAYSVVKKHDGHISVASEPGQGAAFEVYLPASRKIPGKTEPAEEPMPGGRGRGRILFMDDEEIIREMLAKLLISLGFDTQMAENGEQAVELYKKALEDQAPFDVVILDLTVRGGMGGKETIKKMLEIDPLVKAIVSSGYSTDPVMAEYKDHGFKAMLVKPYKPETLSRLIQKLISESED